MKKPYLNISSAGSLIFPKKVLQYFNLDPSQMFYIKLFEDAAKRILGFQIEKIEGELKNLSANWRVIKPTFSKKIKSFTGAVVSVKPFIRALNPELPLSQLEIKTHKDLMFGEIHYVIIPRLKRDTNNVEIE